MPPHDAHLKCPRTAVGRRARVEAVLPVGRWRSLPDGDFPGASGLSGEGENLMDSGLILEINP